MHRKLFFVCVVIKYCSGQELIDIFPLWSKTTTTEEELHAPYLATPSKVRPNFPGSANEITRTAHKPAQVFESVDLPSYLKIVSDPRAIDKFLSEYHAGALNEDAVLNFGKLVMKYGRDFESHEVFTKDGYVLNLFRIPGHGPPVFLMHGLLGSADDFIMAGPESGLAYLLSQQNYDVWLGNARGCKHSRNHISMSTTESTYWDFSWHEIGTQDLPALIDFVLHKTNRTTLKYIGYSQGTTAFFALMSQKPEYNKKVSLMIALSPVAFMTKVRSPVIRLLAPGTSLMQAVSRSSGQYEFLPESKLTRLLKKIICGSGILSDIICSNVIFLMAGFDYSQLNITNLPVIFGHSPSGASMKQLRHYGQGLINDDFRLFDYGSMENLEKYGIMVAPSYNLNNVETPIWMFCSESDWLSDPHDVTLLKNKLKNVIEVYKVPHNEFNHLDFILAKDVKKLVYRMVLKVLSSF